MSIRRLARAEKAEATSVLASAFHDYPVMRYVLKTRDAEYESQLLSLIGFFCEGRFAKEGHVLATPVAGAIAGVALVDEASQNPWPKLKEELARLKSLIGADAYSRLELYERESSAMEPADPHYFLGMIGVLPGHQGNGYASVLLERVKALSAGDSRSAGVCLSTEVRENVPLYERFGYRTVVERDIDELHSWCMYLPTR